MKIWMIMRMTREIMFVVFVFSSCLISSSSCHPSHPSYHPYHPSLHSSAGTVSSFVMPVIHPSSSGSVSSSMMIVSHRPLNRLSSRAGSRRGARGVSSSSHQQLLQAPFQYHQIYHHHVPSHHNTAQQAVSPHVSGPSSVFIPRSLWSDPMDYPLFPSSSSFPPSASVQSLSPVSFIPSASVIASSSSSLQTSSPSSSSSILQSNPSEQRDRVVPSPSSLSSPSASGQSSPPSSPSSSVLTGTPSAPLNLLPQNNNNSIVQEQQMFEKSVMDLLNSNPNFTLPLSYDKFLWTFNNDPLRFEQFQYYPLQYYPISSNGNNGESNVNPTEIQSLGSSTSEITSPSISNTNGNKQENLGTFFYAHGTEHMKVVSLCDKTLALLDYGNPASNQLLRCELFDLEKNPEIAYTEAKKTGIPIQSVSFREMREIINACRVLAEADFSPNTVSVGSPPPPIPVSSHHPGVLHDFTIQAPQSPDRSNSNTGNTNNNNNLIVSPGISSSNETTSSASQASSVSSSSSTSSVDSIPSTGNITPLVSSSSSSSSDASPSSSSSSSESSQASQSSGISSSSVQSSSVSASSSSSSSSSPASSSTSSSSSAFSDKGSSYWASWRALLPGTKWCGLGDSARNYFDLGKRKDVDVCCRAHDHCPIRLKALRMGYGLINLSLYTKSHCDCDEDFKRCLRQANSKSAEMLANFYFNIMKVQCLREDITFVCREYRKNKSTGIDECIRYEEDTNKTPIKMVFVQPEVVTFK